MSTNDTKKRNRIWLWIGALVLVIAIVGAGFLFINNRQNAAEGSEAGTGDIVTAFIGDLSTNATASGEVVTRREARLATAEAGKVADVLVSVGDSVQAEDALLVLDTDALERAVTSAEQTLAIQEANLASLTAPAKAQDLAAAEAAVASAQAQIDNLLAGPSEEDINASEANVRAAQANVWAASEQLQLSQSGAGEAEIASAQAELIAALGQQESTQQLYDNLLKCFSFDLPTGGSKEVCPGLGAPEEQTRFNLEAANANAVAAQAQLDAVLAGPDADAVSIAQAGVSAAQAQLEASEANHALLLKGASEAQIAGAEANLAQVQANLAALQEGPSEAQVVAAETAVEQARISLQRAKNDLADATLTAPFAGVITAVYVNEGEFSNGIALELVDSNNLEIVLEVDEADIGNISIGQPAVISLESWPQTEIQGEVASITPQAKNNGSALVVYEVYLTLDETELPVRVGMTANADLVTSNNENVLLLPNQAINADRGNGTYSVNLVVSDGGEESYQEIQVDIGLRDARFTQILSGLQEGDQVLVGDNLPVQRFGPDAETPESGPGGFGPPPGDGPGNNQQRPFG
jgi:HlyD family secretion protein